MKLLIASAQNAYSLSGRDALNGLILVNLGNDFRIYSGTNLSAGANSSNLNNNIHVGEFNGASSKYWINSLLKNSGNAGTAQMDGIQLGGGVPGFLKLDAEIMEAIGFNRRLSSGERTGLELYLRKKWSI